MTENEKNMKQDWEKLVDNISKNELIELRENLVKDGKEPEKDDQQLDPKIQMAIDMLRMSLINSRAYADSVNTEEKRLAQINRVQQALDRAAYLEASAYWSPENNKPLKK